MNNAGLHLIADAVLKSHRLACDKYSGAVTIVHGDEPCPHADALKNSGAVILFGNQVVPPGVTAAFLESAGALPDEPDREHGYGD